MSFSKLKYECESWLLPYKPLDPNDLASNTAKNLNKQRDSKNRIIITLEALYGKRKEKKSYYISDLNDRDTNSEENPGRSRRSRKNPGGRTKAGSSNPRASSISTSDIFQDCIILESSLDPEPDDSDSSIIVESNISGADFLPIKNDPISNSTPDTFSKNTNSISSLGFNIISRLKKPDPSILKADFIPVPKSAPDVISAPVSSCSEPFYDSIQADRFTSRYGPGPNPNSTPSIFHSAKFRPKCRNRNRNYQHHGRQNSLKRRLGKAIATHVALSGERIPSLINSRDSRDSSIRNRSFNRSKYPAANSIHITSGIPNSRSLASSLSLDLDNPDFSSIFCDDMTPAPNGLNANSIPSSFSNNPVSTNILKSPVLEIPDPTIQKADYMSVPKGDLDTISIPDSFKNNSLASSFVSTPTQSNFNPAPKTTPISAMFCQETKKQGNQPKGRLNSLQRKLGKALATPVTMTKAENMMLKMGWSGGALGKTGAGITEPIVPNLVYATSTKGFGQPETSKRQRPRPVRRKSPKEPNITPTSPKRSKAKLSKSVRRQIHKERAQKSSEAKNVVKDNILTCILDFVKNEREIAIIFDSSLHNGQRKNIHKIVEEIKALDETGVKNKEMNLNAEREIVMEIVKTNRYVLQTQSEGEHPNRCLCLFKDAPEMMFLITHYKLNDKPNDFVKIEESAQIRGNVKKRKTKKELRKLKWMKRNKRGLIDKNCSGNKELNTLNTRVVDDDKKDDETVIDYIEVIDSDEEIKTDEKFDQVKDISNIHEQKMGIVEKTTESTCNMTKIDETIINEKELERNLTTSIGYKTDEYMIDNNNEYTFKTEGILQPKIESEQISKELKPEISDANLNKASNEEDANVNLNDQSVFEQKQTLQEFDIKISIDTSCRKEFLRYNLNMCFSDFMTGSRYKEFKFLGDFDIQEFEVMTEFVSDFFLVMRGERAVDEEFMGVWQDAKCKLSYKRDWHGGIVIYKGNTD